MDYCRAGGWVLISVGLALAVASCDGRDDVSQITGQSRPDPSGSVAADGESRCVPGQTSPCIGVCEGFGLGYQVCAADGRSYGQCSCPSVAPLSSTGGGATVIPSRFPPGEGRAPVDLPGAAPAAAVIGATCARDADCGGELNCFEASRDSLGFGGPAGGYCSIRCDTAAACTALDRESTCGTLGGRALCLHTCRSQDPAAPEDKCLGRAGVACLSSAAIGDEEPTTEPQLGVCIPSCQSDAACGGRACDLSTGLCTETPRAGDPIGAACDGPESCASGLCLGATADRTGFCSAFCTFGAPGCGYDGTESAIEAGCLLPQVPSEGAGDRGLCLELCDVPEDCVEPGFLCVPEPSSGRAGVCLPPSAPPQPAPGAAPSGEENVGAPCARDLDCGVSLVCLEADGDPFGLGGGPAQGYCSLRCEFAEDCPPGDVCGITDGGGFCLKGCDPEARDACGGRETTECVPLFGQAACLPVCLSDDACGARVCDLELGLCVDAAAAEEPSDEPTGEPEAEGPDAGAPTLACSSDDECVEGVCDPEAAVCTLSPAGCTADEECGERVCNVLDGACIEPPPLPIGAPCTGDAECLGEAAAEEDARVCLPVAASTFCSGLCIWGTPFGCEAYGTDAFCLLPVQDDIGACLELCNVAEECEQPGYECLSVGTVINGRSGACLPPAPAAVSLTRE